MRFRPSAKALFPELEGREVTPRLENKPSIEIPTSELPGLITANETSVHSIIYLNRSTPGMATLIPLPEGTAMQRTREALYSAGEIRETQEKLLGIFSGIPAYELQYRDLNQAIEQLDRLVRSI